MAEADAPAWLGAAFVKEALRRGGDEGALVKSVTLRPVGAAGDHYASVMYRATCETATGAKTLIVKTLPAGELMQKALKDSGIFSTESLFISEIIPKMHQLLEDAAPGRFPPFAAKCPHHGTEPSDFLFLEDLAPQGFRLADRKRGLGLRHSLLALRTLARFHAASAALLSQDPTLPNIVVNPFTMPNSEPFQKFIATGWQQTTDACKKWPNFPPEYAGAVEAAKHSAYEKYASINDYRPGRFNVIAHGDFWMNNMMFRYEGEVLKDIRLVDFQLPHVTTPAVDILYFLNTSVSEDVYDNHLDLLIREYHTALCETVQLLGVEAPSLKELLVDIDDNGFYATYGSLVILPIVKAEEIPDLDKSLAGDGSDNNFIFSSAVERWFLRIIPMYLKKGWLV